jgi:hypothetical protein
MKNQSFIKFQNVNRNKYRLRKLKPTTYIFAARCKDGVAIISDRLETMGQKRNYVNKIERPAGLPVIFAAAGSAFLFKDYIRELSRKVAVNAGLKEFDIQKWKEAGLKNPVVISNHSYNTHDFIMESTNLLREFRAMYAESSARQEMLLQVVFVVPEDVGGVNRPRLFYSDFLNCQPIPIENNCHVIGQADLALEFKEEWNDDMTMIQTIKLATFIIKYIEKSGLSKIDDMDTVGVGDLMPQVYFFADNDTQPKAIEGEELKQMISGVDAELEEVMKIDKSREKYLKKFPTLWALK